MLPSLIAGEVTVPLGSSSGEHRSLFGSLNIRVLFLYWPDRLGDDLSPSEGSPGGKLNPGACPCTGRPKGAWRGLSCSPPGTASQQGPRTQPWPLRLSTLRRSIKDRRKRAAGKVLQWFQGVSQAFHPFSEHANSLSINSVLDYGGLN